MVVTLASELVVSPGRISGLRGSSCDKAASSYRLRRLLANRLPSDESPADHHRPSRKVRDLQTGSGSFGPCLGSRRQIFVRYTDGF